MSNDVKTPVIEIEDPQQIDVLPTDKLPLEAYMMVLNQTKHQLELCQNTLEDCQKQLELCGGEKDEATEQAKTAKDWAHEAKNNSAGLNVIGRIKAYVIGDMVYSPWLPSWAYLECVGAGVTSGAELDFNGVELWQELVDGSVTWKVQDLNRVALPLNRPQGIVRGLDVALSGNRLCKVGQGMANIGEFVAVSDADLTVTLPLKTAGLLTMDKEKNIAIHAAKIPAADEYTICQYRFDITQSESERLIKDKSVNGLDAVIKSGVVVCPGIDGTDAAEFNGTTDYAETDLVIPMPLANAEKEVDFVFELTRPSVQNSFAFSLFSTSTAQNLTFWINSAQHIVTTMHSADYDTGVIVSPNTLYYIVIRLKEGILETLLNGRVIHRVERVGAHIQNLKLRIGGYYAAAHSTGYAFPGRMYYLEFREKVRTDLEIAKITNNMLIPNTHRSRKRTLNIVQPALKLNTTYDEFIMDKLNVTNSGNRKNKVEPELVGSLALTDGEFGATPSFDANAANYYNCGNVTFNKDKGWTVIAFVKNSAAYTADKRFAGGKGAIFALGEGADNQFGLWYGGWKNTADHHINPYGYNFCVAKYSNSVLKLALNDAERYTNLNGELATTNVVFSIGLAKTDGNANPFKGEIPYLAVFDRELTTAEVKELYDHFVSEHQLKQDIAAIIDANKISLGYFRTDDTSIVDCDFKNRRYGRIEIGRNNLAETPWMFLTTGRDVTVKNLLGDAGIISNIMFNPIEPSFNGASVMDNIYSSGGYGTWIVNANSQDFMINCGPSAVYWSDFFSAPTGYIKVIYRVADSEI